MATHMPPDDPPLLAVAALDDFVAEIVRQARGAGLAVPPRFFDWATGEGTRLVEGLVRRRLAELPRGAPPELVSAVRCAVRYWAAPWVVAQFDALRPLFPELEVRGQQGELSVLVRTGRWRCASGAACTWRLCERAG